MSLAERKAFLLYTGYFEQIEMLNIEQRGILLTAIMAYQTGADLPEMDALTKMAYSFISADMRRDGEKYEEVIEKRRESGRKGGQATQAKRANATFATFASNSDFKQNQANQANQAVYVDVKEDVDVKEEVDVDVKMPAGGSDTDTHKHIPTYGEIDVYCIQHGIQTDVKKFYDYNSGRGWPMEWTAALALWVKKDSEKKEEKQSGNRFSNFPQRNYSSSEYEELGRLLNGKPV